MIEKLVERIRGKVVFHISGYGRGVIDGYFLIRASSLNFVLHMPFVDRYILFIVCAPGIFFFFTFGLVCSK